MIQGQHNQMVKASGKSQMYTYIVNVCILLFLFGYATGSKWDNSSDLTCYYTITSQVRRQMIIFLDIKLNSTREKFISSSKSLVCPCLDITLKNHMSWLNTVLNSFGQIATIVQSVVWLTRVSLKCICICIVCNYSFYIWYSLSNQLLMVLS